MTKHFPVLLVGTAVFLCFFLQCAWEAPARTPSSSSETAPAPQTEVLAEGLRLLGLYAAFAVLVIGHGVSCAAGEKDGA